MFGPTTEQVATYKPRYDADGTVWRQTKAHGELTVRTAYRLTSNQYGPVTEAITDTTTYYRVTVPDETIASDALFWGQTGGFRSSMVTPSIDIDSNDGFSIDGGVIADDSVFAEASGGFAIAQCDDDGSAATTHDVMLLDREILSES